MHKQVRIIDIAEKASVSPGTVDRVIHNRGEVSPQTREHVLKIIREMDYKPDILARLLASKKSYRIAVILPESMPENEFWKAPLEGMAQAIAEINYQGFLLEQFLFDQYDKASFCRSCEQVLRSKPAAIVFAPVFRTESLTFVSDCNREGIRVVLINSRLEQSDYLTFIGQDSFASGMLAGRLISSGLADGDELLVVNIAAEKDNYQHILNREKGFITFFRRHPQLGNIAVNRVNVPENEEAALSNSLLGCLKEHSKARGIFVTNSRVFHVARLLRDWKNGRPLLIGYDLIESNLTCLGQELIDYLISQKPGIQGYQAIRCLFDELITNKPVEKDQFIPIDIITKENLNYYSYHQQIQ